jgi:hypothetical protein
VCKQAAQVPVIFEPPCIFVHKDLNYSAIDLGKYCKDQDIEVCVLKLEPTSFNTYIMAVYRAPMGNFNLFLNRLADIIGTLYKVDSKFIYVVT